jgi:hypothetical protein
MSVDVGDFISTNQGHIHYELDGGGVIMKYDDLDVVFDITDEGEHTLVVELVDTSHNSLNPIVRKTIVFEVVGPTPNPTATPQPTPNPTATVANTANTIFLHIPN